MKEKDFIKKAVDEAFEKKEQIRMKAVAAGRQQKVKRSFFMKKGLAITIIIAVIAVAGLTAMSAIYTPQKYDYGQPMKASAYSEVIDAIEEYYKKQNSFQFRDILGGVVTSDKAAPEMVNESAAPSSDYSQTNVQTNGMDEGDIVKNDDRYIYKITTQGCFIIETNNGALETKSSIVVENYVPQELYVQGDTLIMIGGIYEQRGFAYMSGIEPMMDCIGYLTYNKTDIRVYDISDRTAPSLERQITIDGGYYSSRIKEEGNKLYYMVNYSFSYGDEESYIPRITDTAKGETSTKIPVENIYIYGDVSYYSYLIVGEVALDEPEADSAMLAYLGLGGEIYVSTDNIYVATYDSYSRYDTNIFGWVKNSVDNAPSTRLVKIALSDLKHKATSRINGTVKDRYSLDEYNGYLRVAVTVSARTTFSNLYVLRPDLTVIGKVEKVAEGERIYSVRFNANKCVMVTFKNMDPYFIFDLTDPAKPFITGELKEDGVSHYIHYIEGTDYTVGIGMMSRVQHTPYGDRVEWTGLKVSLYDNSGSEAVNVKNIEIPGSCHAEIFYNPKALLYNKERGLIAFSYENWQYDDYYYYSSMTQGLAVFGFDLTQEDENKLAYKGTLTNLEEEVGTNDWYGYYADYLTFINRGIQIGDYIYTVSDKYIASYDIASLELVQRLDLTE
ncbi:MAG: beta-propeller domain-containing protein [Clostridia bacterium]|nr:beta-propeller domain-containing protein [Clostridia bacterium]